MEIQQIEPAVVLFGGTIEGRRLSELLANLKVMLHVCVATEYGASFVKEKENVKVHIGRMDQKEMENFFQQIHARLCIDATHPYAEAVTKNAKEASKAFGICCLRVQRESSFSSYEEDGLIFVESTEEAAKFLSQTQGKILITTGSKELDAYTLIPDYKERCIARVLPMLSVMEHCKNLGFEGKNLIGMQGPFGLELNYWMLKQTEAVWLVTKDSGKEGGFFEKYEAAVRAGAKIIVIKRPESRIGEGKTDKGNFSTELNQKIKKEINREIDVQEGSQKQLTWEDTVGWVQKWLLKEQNIICSTADTIVPDNKENQISNLNETLNETSNLNQILPLERTAYIIGIGPGNREQLTKEAETVLEGCDVIIGAKRMTECCKSRKADVFISYKKEEIAEYLNRHPEYQKVGLVYSGDIGFYSGAKGMRSFLSGWKIVPVSGIASPIYFLNKLGISWEKIPLVSCHGKKASLIPTLLKHGQVCSLFGRGEEIQVLCEKLMELGLENAEITVGEWLSYPQKERIVSGSPKELFTQEFSSLCIGYLKLPDSEGYQKNPICFGISDKSFIRGKVPMTKQGVRILSLTKLQLESNSVLYDVGAGTGSVSIEAALQCTEGMVYSIEKKQDAVVLLLENKKKFHVENMEIVAGEAPDCLEQLPVPTHVFLGGTGGNLVEIVQVIRRKNKTVRFVCNAITLETLGRVQELLTQFPEYENTFEVMQVNLAVGKRLGRYHLMTAQNPVFLVCFGGEEDGMEE